jgi:predicted RNase H-like nuclease
MDQQRAWYAIKEYTDRRSKYNRIISGLNGVASAGRMFVQASQTDFIEQFSQYPDVAHDDILDASAIALMELEGLYVTEEGHLAAAANEAQSNPLNIYVAP